MSLIYPDQSYQIIGCCYEVYNQLGNGFLEIVYKDALEYEFSRNNIPYGREVEYKIEYKSTVLPHKYFADFVVYDKIILEVKAVAELPEKFIAQTINYLKVSKNKLGLLVNFSKESLEYRRIVF